jgi:hypothetical protein
MKQNSQRFKLSKIPWGLYFVLIFYNELLCFIVLKQLNERRPEGHEALDDDDDDDDDE